MSNILYIAAESTLSHLKILYSNHAATRISQMHWVPYLRLVIVNLALLLPSEGKKFLGKICWTCHHRKVCRVPPNTNKYRALVAPFPRHFSYSVNIVCGHYQIWSSNTSYKLCFYLKQTVSINIGGQSGCCSNFNSALGNVDVITSLVLGW